MIGSAQTTPTHTFPSTVQAFIRSLVFASPPLGHALIISLTIRDNPTYLVNNETIQLIYIDCIDIHLKKILDSIETTTETTPTTTETTPSTGGETVVSEKDAKIHDVLEVLSLVDPSPEMSRIMKQLDKIFVVMLQIMAGGKYLFSVESIYGVLIGRESQILVKRFQDVEEYLRKSVTTVSQLSPSEGGRGQDGRGQEVDHQQVWRERFYVSLREKQHFLERSLVSEI